MKSSKYITIIAKTLKTKARSQLSPTYIAKLIGIRLKFDVSAKKGISISIKLSKTISREKQSESVT